MKIIYELTNKLFVLDILNKSENSFIKKTITWWLEKLKTYGTDSSQMLLIDDERFNFYSFHIVKEYEKAFSIKESKEILNEKLNSIKLKYWNCGKFLFYHLDDFFVDWEPVEHILWKKWKISYRLNLAFIDQKTYILFQSILWTNFFANKNYRIFPQSFFTLTYLKKKLARNNLNLLYIFDNEIKLVKVENWFYSSISKINLWIDRLKSIFRDNNISLLLYKSYKTKDFNEFSKKLIDDCFDFYNKMLIKWLWENIGKGTDCILFTSLLQNDFFLENFNEQYQKNINWYILPFHYSGNLNLFWRKWDPDKTDILIALNNI